MPPYAAAVGLLVWALIMTGIGFAGDSLHARREARRQKARGAV